MALPTTSNSSWLSGIDLPNQLFEMGSDDYELYEDEDTFVLSVEMPGYDPEEIAAEYTNGILEVRLPIEEGATVHGRKIEVQT